MRRRALAGLLLALMLLSGIPRHAAPVSVLSQQAAPAAARAGAPHPAPPHAGLAWDDHPTIRPQAPGRHLV